MSDVTVACVLRSGGVYDMDWVRRLKRSLHEHLPGCDFVCLTNMPGAGSWRAWLEHAWPGWWSKLELFRPDLFRGRVLYLDLDTLIVGDLSEIASYDGPLAMLNDFYQGRKLAASGVMAFTPGPHTERIYEAFVDHGRIPGGRLDYWLRKVAPKPDRLQDLFPGQIVSYKKHARDSCPEDARLVCFHGNPRPSDPRAGWAHERWKAA